MNGNADNVFFLDGIRFTGEIKSAMEAPVMLRSYDTENLYIKNTAFTYDNALAAMAFLSEGKQKESKEILDALVYAVRNDRSFRPAAAGTQTDEKMVSVSIVPRRVRNAYAAGAINAFPGWESGARLSGLRMRCMSCCLDMRGSMMRLPMILCGDFVMGCRLSARIRLRMCRRLRIRRQAKGISGCGSARPIS